MTKAARIARRKGKTDRKRTCRINQGNYKGTSADKEE